jgi:hypothetical protein
MDSKIEEAKVQITNMIGEALTRQVNKFSNEWQSLIDTAIAEGNRISQDIQNRAHALLDGLKEVKPPVELVKEENES